MTELRNRYEFVVLFDVENGNPNGDPDAGNLPRIDFETSKGLITDVCLKRKIRNYVELVKKDCNSYKIYVKEGVPLNINREKAYAYLDLTPKGNELPKLKDKDKEKEIARKLKEFMCQTFYDVRTFGAMMQLKVNCGVVRGPVQINFAQSIDPINSNNVSITSITMANVDEPSSKMGRKQIVPYALYRTEGYVSANLAQKTGFSQEDLELLWDAIINMFEHDHSAARGKMAVRKLFVFKHDSELGNAPSHKLFDLIKVNKKENADVIRSIDDYEINVNYELPQGVELIEKI